MNRTQKIVWIICTLSIMIIILIIFMHIWDNQKIRHNGVELKYKDYYAIKEQFKNTNEPLIVCDLDTYKCMALIDIDKMVLGKNG